MTHQIDLDEAIKRLEIAEQAAADARRLITGVSPESDSDVYGPGNGPVDAYRPTEEARD